MESVAFVVIGLLTMIFIFILTWARRYKKVGPNDVMVIFGRRRKVRSAQTGESGTSKSLETNGKRNINCNFATLCRRIWNLQEPRN